MSSQPAASKCLSLGALGISIAFITFACSAHAQTLAASASPAPPSPSSSSAVSSTVRARPAGPAALSPWDFSINEAVQHDSSTGWSDILTPSVFVRPASHLVIAAGIPWYPSLAAYTSSTVNGTTTTALAQHHNVLGDAGISAIAGGSHGDFGVSGGAALGFATGNQSLGVSAGQTTWHFGTHLEYSIGAFTPDIEAGIGNSSAFASRMIRKSYTAVGQMANFQAGTSIDLPARLSLDVEAYEAMPIQTQNLYGTIGRRNSRATGRGRSKQTAVQGVTGSGEDNGFNLGLEYPLTRKLTLATQYDSSLIQADNIVAFSVRWNLHGAKAAESGVPLSPIAHPGD